MWTAGCLRSACMHSMRTAGVPWRLSPAQCMYVRPSAYPQHQVDGAQRCRHHAAGIYSCMHAPWRAGAHLDVAVDAVLAVQVHQRLQHLAQDVGDAGLVQGTVRDLHVQAEPQAAHARMGAVLDTAGCCRLRHCRHAPHAASATMLPCHAPAMPLHAEVDDRGGRHTHQVCH